MKIARYAGLFEHFDTLLHYDDSCSFISSMDPIRDVYEKFGNKTGMMDICKTRVQFIQNPIQFITAFLVHYEYNFDLNDGLIPYDDIPVFVYTIPKSVLDNIRIGNYDSGNAIGFIRTMYDVISSIVSFDPLYTTNDLKALRNPYLASIRCIPFYFTYKIAQKYFIGETMKDDINDEFRHILSKYFIDPDSGDINRVIESVKKSKFSPFLDDIYSAMTDKGQVAGLFT